MGGAQYDNTGPLEQPVRPLSEVGRDETFPLYEDRSIRPDPLGLRHTFPGQAFGFKMTAYLREKLAVGSPDYSPEVEIAFLNEIGVDQVDIVLDSSAWCRALRFALNVEGGGFDPRWHSGDYSEYMTADMLLHPSVPLRLEDCLQSSKQFFLDENDFPSSDLFNATVRSTNICFRVPAAISEDIRSCDILIRSSEVMLTISSALPRTLVHEDVATQGDSIEFPNDPSDVVYTLEKAEDPSNRQRGIMTSKAMSTFRFQLTVRGLAVQLEPVIPFHASKEAQQLLLPAEMTMIFCFEGELLELSSEKNLARIVLFISVIVHRLELNFDFDLIASAAITFSFHLKNVLITAAACSGGAYGNKPSEGTEAEGMVGRTRNSLRGRKVLVRRQITRSRESGGLSVACCANVFETRVCIWRQNIPRKRPLCSANKDTGEYVPLLRIIDFAFKKIDFGIEASFCQEQSRLLIKTSVAKISLEVCDFESVLQTDSVWTKSYVHSSQSQVPVGEVTMAKIFSCGSEESKRFAFAFRFEEVLDITRSWSLSSDFADGLVDCQVDELQTFVLLVLDSLLMPCWVRFEPGESQKMRLFPRDTLGNFLMSLLPDLPSVDIADHLKRDDAQIRDELMRSLPGKKIDRVLKVVTKALPMTVDMLLLRVSMNNLLLRIPTGGASPLLSNYDGVGLKLCDASFVASYFATDIAEQVRILDVFAQKREKWSSVVLTREKGLRHGLKSRQSVLFTKSGSEGFAKQVEEGLVEEFEFGYSYGDSKISVLTPDDILIANVDKLEDFLVFILRFADRCNVVFANTATILKAAVGHVGSNVNDVTPRESPISMACSSAVESLRSVKSWFRRINDTLGTYDELTQSVVTEKDKEIANLRQLVFLKEKERLAALALVSSEVTGWLRLGTAQRSGQRGLMSCMLWPHWVMLRRSLLLLYAGPGQVRL